MNTKYINKHTLRLFKNRPSFKDGVFAIFETGSLTNNYNHDKTEEAADSNSIMADWSAVGDDLRTSISYYEQSR